MLDSAYHMTLKFLKNAILRENIEILPFLRNGRHYVTLELYKHDPIWYLAYRKKQGNRDYSVSSFLISS